MKLKAFAVALSILATGMSALFAGEPAHDRSGTGDCAMKSEHAPGVDQRGDKGMGFSHTKTTHHFRILSNGGAIEVTANDAADQTSRDQIRRHLEQIAKLFAEGNFEIPMFVHDKMPDGAAGMQQMKAKIAYRYEEREMGGRVRIVTSDAAALAAVHDFLRFQIKDHRTGDPLQAFEPKGTRPSPHNLNQWNARIASSWRWNSGHRGLMD